MTKGEIQAVLFVAVSLLAGAFILLVKQFDADFLPDLAPASADVRPDGGNRTESAAPAGNAMAVTERSSGAEAGPGTSTSSAGVSANSASSVDNLQVPINTAPASELQKLPGIGPSLAERIIAYRKQSGNFATVEQLLEVKGIGPAKLKRLRPFVALP